MKKFNIKEGQESLNRVLLLMKYDNEKTLTENIEEQKYDPKLDIDPKLRTTVQDRLDPINYNPIKRDFGNIENYLKAMERNEKTQRDGVLKMYILNKKPLEVKTHTLTDGSWNKDGKIVYRDDEKYWKLPYDSPRYEIMVKNNEIKDVSKYLKGNKVDKYFSSSKYRELLESIYELDYQEWNSLYGPKAQNREAHSLLGSAELILTGIGILATFVAGFFTGGGAWLLTAEMVASVSLGLAFTAGLADAALYLNEGDTYSALMAGALTIIPGDELFKILKKTGKMTGISESIFKNIINAPDEMLPIIKKGRGGLENLNPKELEKYLTWRKATLMNAAIIGRESVKYSVKALKETIKKLPFGKLLYKLTKMSSGLIKAGATAYTVDQIWLAYSVGESMSAEQRRKMRTYLAELPDGSKTNLGSDFGQLMDYAYDEGLLKTMKLIGIGLWSMIWGENGEPNEEGRKKIKTGINEKIEALPETEDTLSKFQISDEEAIELKNELNKSRNIVKSQLNKILSSKPGHNITVNMLKTGKGTIQKGDKGNSTKYVQQLLSQLKDPYGRKYDLGNSGPNKNGVDADFGDSTETAVVSFQMDYVFDDVKDKGEIDGVVGKETINKMEEVLKNQKK